MKLLIDMNLSPRWVDFLGSAGYDVAHWSSVGSVAARDSEITEYAIEHGYVIMTHDLDFSAILAASKGSKPSIIQIRAEDISPEVIGLPVINALVQMEQELSKGALVTIDPGRTRLRILPFA